MRMNYHDMKELRFEVLKCADVLDEVNTTEKKSILKKCLKVSQLIGNEFLLVLKKGLEKIKSMLWQYCNED